MDSRFRGSDHAQGLRIRLVSRGVWTRAFARVAGSNV
ncbi:hypothetical protein EDC27_2028 [Desulfosoma caldarium]|uniref:Uncharacterized protein n=1 Tax=Desulfosoma caldarium TaxID=610254 RepID=A0A3N1UQG2_9BACT|nr:hypothetical protein EDC27_2028 [Desulfosoma caldarium]